MEIQHCRFWRHNGLRLIPKGLTNCPLSLVCCGQVKDVCLIARVGFVVGFNINGELLNEGTGVSAGTIQNTVTYRDKSSMNAVFIHRVTPQLSNSTGDETFSVLKTGDMRAEQICCRCRKSVSQYPDFTVQRTFFFSTIVFLGWSVTPPKQTDSLGMRGHHPGIWADLMSCWVIFWQLTLRALLVLAFTAGPQLLYQSNLLCHLCWKIVLN